MTNKARDQTLSKKEQQTTKQRYGNRTGTNQHGLRSCFDRKDLLDKKQEGYPGDTKQFSSWKQVQPGHEDGSPKEYLFKKCGACCIDDANPVRHQG